MRLGDRVRLGAISPKQRMVASTSNVVETFIVRYASRDTLSRSVEIWRTFSLSNAKINITSLNRRNIVPYKQIGGQRIEWWCHNFNRKFINSRFYACAVKVWLKIPLNAVRLPKFETINRKSWSPRTMVVKELRQRWMLTWFCACAQSCVIFSTGPYTVLADNSICLNRSAIKVV